MMSDKVVVKDEVLEAGVDNFGFEHVKLWALSCEHVSELSVCQAPSCEGVKLRALNCEQAQLSVSHAVVSADQKRPNVVI